MQTLPDLRRPMASTPPVCLTRRISKDATAEAQAAISSTFPSAVEATAFLDSVASQLDAVGISRGNCIALVSSCRDEASRVLDTHIAEKFGLVFNLHGLAGIPPGGLLAMRAGCSHSPVSADGRDRYVFFGMTHIGIDEAGTVGSVRRIGQPAPSGACGALLHLASELSKGIPLPAIPPEDDLEYYTLRRKVEALLSKASDVVAVTNAAAQAITDTLQDMISKSVDPAKADFAVITGIQIHSGVNSPGAPFSYERVAEFFVPVAAYAVIGACEQELKVQ